MEFPLFCFHSPGSALIVVFFSAATDPTATALIGVRCQTVWPSCPHPPLDSGAIKLCVFEKYSGARSSGFVFAIHLFFAGWLLLITCPAPHKETNFFPQ